VRFLEFFTVNIRNKNTRTGYAHAAGAFLRWCEGQGIDQLGRVQPVHVAAYIVLPQSERAAATWRTGSFTRKLRLVRHYAKSLSENSRKANFFCVFSMLGIGIRLIASVIENGEHCLRPPEDEGFAHAIPNRL
jgi:site-specific recombinase XerD